MNSKTTLERATRARASVPQPAKMQLAFRCVDLPASGPEFDAFEDMCAHAREITFDTFASKVDWKPIAKEMGYATEPGAAGLRLDKDQCVRYHRSKLKGETVYFMVHSAIEFVFKHPAAAEPVKRPRMGTPWQ